MIKYGKCLKLVCFWICIWLFLIVPVSISTANIEESAILPVLKIAIVNSYDIGHVCGSPQTQGIIDSLNKRLSKKYQFDFQVWYMKSDLIFDTQDKLSYISKKVITDIKSFDPDHIFVVDDAAFKHAGIPMSKEYDIFFTGINKPLLSYASDVDFNINRFYGVEEVIPLKRMLVMLDNVEFYPSKIWILADSSTTSFFLTESYREELKKETSFNVEVITLTRASDLRKTLSNIQKEKPGLIIHSYQNLKDDDYGGFIPKKYLVKDIPKYNKKHLDICENCYYAKSGISMVVAPDFYFMGSQVVDIFSGYLDGVHTNKFLKSKTKVSINIQRLEELGFTWVYRKIIGEVDSSYATY